LAIKKTGVAVSMVGNELKKFLKAIEAEEKSSITLGETSGPLLDLYETAESVVVEADIPGIDPDDVEISVLNGILTIEGMKKEKVEETTRINYLCMERSFETFRRILRISVPINPKKATAVYASGVLTVTFPKLKDKRGEVVVVKVRRG
jgi:HSP20 family protein